MKTKLPEGWKEVELGELADCLDGDWILSADMSETGEIGLVQLKHIGEGKFLNKKFNFITKERCNKLKCTFLKKGDLLVSRMAEPICRSCILPELEFDTITSVDVTIVRPLNNSVIKEYLNILFNSNLIKNQVENYTTGTTRARISRKNLERLKVILPPFLIQQKIVSILEKAEKAKEMRKEADELTKELLKAVFVEMFRKKFTIKKLGELSSKISSGSTPLGGSENYLDGGEILFIRSQNVLMNKFSNHDKLYISKEIHENMKRTWVKKYDILLNITGASIGRTAIYLGEDDKANVNQHVCIIRIEDFKIINPIYLNYYLSGDKIQRHIQLTNAGGTREALNYAQIKNFDIPVPPIELQNKFASIVKEVESMKEQQKRSKEQIDNLFNILIQKAFKGELVI